MTPAAAAPPGAARPPIRWGVLGAAAIAVQRTMPAMREAPAATLLAIASRDAGRARSVAAAHGVPRAYDRYDDLLADPDIDAVYVPLPNQLHFEWSVKALEAGKHVLCEKPLTLSSAEAAELCAVRDRTGRHVEEAFGFRNHPQWDAVARLQAAGTLGAVRSAHATLAKQFLDPADIRNDPAAGGGALYDLGAYAISGFNLLFGRAPLRVVAALERCPRFGIDRLSSALLDYGAAHAALTVATQSGPAAWATHQQLSVLCAQGWLQFDFPFAHARPTECHLAQGDGQSVGAFATRTETFEPTNQYARQVQRFSRLLQGHAEPSWPIEDAVGTLRVIEALLASARSGGWVAVAG